MKLLVVIFSLAIVSQAASSDCEGREDGTVMEWGCQAYTHCVNEEEVFVDCAATDEVFNIETQQCDDPENAPAPCGQNKDDICTEAADGRYADYIQHCEYFYTCVGGTYFGHNPCNPGTVFDEVLCLCNYPSEVYAPCGTKPDDADKPEERGCPL